MSAMIHQISAVWLGWMTASSGQIALFVVLIALAALLLHRFPARFRYALWILVLIKIFLPPTLGTSWGIGAWAMSPIGARMYPGAPTAAIQKLWAIPQDKTVERTSGVIFVESRSSNEPRPTASQRMGTSQWLFGIWFAGLVGFLGFVTLRYMGLVRKLRSGRIVDEGPLCIELERVAQSLQVNRTPGLMLSDSVKSPFLVGIFRPWIVLPDNLLGQLSTEEMHSILMHEMIHWRRRDLIVVWVQVLAQAVFWFHPFVWLANARLRHERECACDEAAVGRPGCEPQSYAESLLKVLLAARARSSVAMGFLGIFERYAKLQERLEVIMNTKHGSKKVGLLRWGLLAALAAVLLPMAPRADSTQGSEGVATYIVTFKSRDSGKLQDVEELLAAFNSQHPQNVRTHHYRTTNVGGIRIGYICVDGKDGLDAVLKMLKTSQELALVDYADGTEERLKRLYEMPQEPDKVVSQTPQTGPPNIISTTPAVGATDVDPNLQEITVTFDRDMRNGMSWTGGAPNFPPCPEGKKCHWRDKRTCVVPVQLKPASYYRVGINSKSHNNFRAENGVPSPPSAIYFTTQGASEELKRKVRLPRVASLEPPNGASNVDPNLKEIRVTFDMPMGGGMSWVGSGPNFPERPEGQNIRWSEDKRTCIMPVRLKPNWQYQISLNSPSHINFQSEGGVPLEPVKYTFSTGPEATTKTK
jgi:beta-lactamase regulating signal transducer with metallopeptidase domain